MRRSFRGYRPSQMGLIAFVILIAISLIHLIKMNFFLSSKTGQVLNTGAIFYNGSLDSSKSEDSPGYTIDTYYGNKVAPMDIIEETQHHVDRASQQNEPKPAKANMSVPTEVLRNKCAFCEGASGIFHVNLVVPRTGGNTCGSIKRLAANESNRSDICTIIQKEEEMCCPQSPYSLCRFKDTTMGLCHFIPYGNNFGDEIGPLVSKKLVKDHFNCKEVSLPVWNLAKKGARKGTCLFSLGSIFHMVENGDHIWGTGVNPTWQRQVPGNLTIHAVRGPHTEDFLKARGVIKESVGHGDPGLLLPLVSPASINKGNENRFCFVAHAQDKDIVNDLVNQKDLLSPAVHVIHAQAHLSKVVENLLTCSHIASTSLHGLILADAFGIPSRWFQFPKSKTEKTEGHFKYQDYYSTIGRDDATHAEIFEDIFNTSTYWEILAEERRHDVVQTLNSTFPYHLFYSTMVTQFAPAETGKQ